jgi:hypothetical protein
MVHADGSSTVRKSDSPGKRLARSDRRPAVSRTAGDGGRLPLGLGRRWPAGTGGGGGAAGPSAAAAVAVVRRCMAVGDAGLPMRMTCVDKSAQD